MKKTFGRAVATTVAATLVLGMALTGCGKKDVDYNVDGEDSASGGEGGTLTSRLGIPESYSGSLEGIDNATGLTEVKIDAATITVPDSDKMSVVYYEPVQGDNEYRKRICENFFDVNSGIYVYSWDKPYKEDVEREIEQWKTLMASATSDDELNYYQEYLDELNEQLKDASTEREGAGNYDADTYVGSVGENMFMLSFSTGEAEGGGAFSISYYPSDALVQYKSVEGAAYAYCYSDDFTDEENSSDVNKASMTEDDAVARTLEFLAGCGISDVVETNVSGLTWDFSDANYETLETVKDGYAVTLKRSVNGIAPYTPYVYSLDVLSTSDAWYDTANETFEISIDDNNILEAYCSNFYKATGQTDDNVDIMTWEEALAALPAAINKYYTAYTTSYSSIDFNDVRLSYYKLKDGDVYKYTPVWVFAQCEDYDGKLDYDYPTQLIMLDAVTGEYIDIIDNVETSEMLDSVGEVIEDDADTVDESGDEDTEEIEPVG